VDWINILCTLVKQILINKSMTFAITTVNAADVYTGETDDSIVYDMANWNRQQIFF
jgi:hypothetical protein